MEAGTRQPITTPANKAWKEPLREKKQGTDPVNRKARDSLHKNDF